MSNNNEILRGACIVGQSGGPTAVINASLYGVVRTALDSDCITEVYGAANGVRGVLDDRLYDMSKEDAAELALLPYTPSSALGSCRYKLAEPEEDDRDYVRILEIFKKYNVRYFFYNGGNDSMDSCSKIDRYLKSVGYECRVIGVPKTIDNDLFGTDHSPGFGSAAKYIATTVAEVCLDATVYDQPMITVIEIMGRHAGWLAGSAALACGTGSGPDLVYLPEVCFDLDKFNEDVQRIFEEKGKVVIAVSEGVHDKDGRFISEYGTDTAGTKDAFGHAQLGGLAQTLVSLLKTRFNAKMRGIELSLLQRCAAHCASKQDITEAQEAGRAAVLSAIGGATGYMVAIKRGAGEEYSFSTELVELSKVANYEQKVPQEWIRSDGSGVTAEFLDYVRPLTEGETELRFERGLPRFARLEKVRV